MSPIWPPQEQKIAPRPTDAPLETDPDSPAVRYEASNASELDEFSEFSEKLPGAEEGISGDNEPLIDGLSVEEYYRYNPEFALLPTEAQKFILNEIREGRYLVVDAAFTRKKEKHTAYVFEGQWKFLSRLAKQCPPPSGDGRHKVTRHVILRELLVVFEQMLHPHMDLSSASTPSGVRKEIVRAVQQAGRENKNPFS